MKTFQRTVDFSAGMDNLHATHLVGENAAGNIQNAQIDYVGRLYTRPGVSVLGGRGSTPGGLAVYAPPAGDRRTVGIWPPSVYQSALNSIWLQTASTCSLVSGLHGAVMGRDAVGDWKNYLFSVEESPSDASFWHSLLVAVNPNTGDWTQRSDIRPGCAAFWQGRLWIGDCCQTDVAPDVLLWSKLWDAGDFSAYAENQIQIDAGIGGRLTAIVPARGGDPQLYLFKERSCYLMTVAWNTDGWIPGSADDLDTTTANIQNLSYRVGCIAPLSAIWVPAQEGGDCYFLSHDGVRSLRRTQEDVAAGGGGLSLTHLIPDTVDRINWDWARRAVATTHKNYYYLALPLDGSKTNNYVLVKNLLIGPYEGWSLWNLPACTVVGDVFPSPRLFFQGAVATSDTLPAGATATLAAGVFELDPDIDNLDPGGSAINLVIDTRAYDVGRPEVRKDWRWAEIQYSADETGATVWVLAKIDDETTWQTLGTFFAENYTAGVTLPARLPWDLSVDKLQNAKFGLEDVNAAYRLQLRLDTTGWGTLYLRSVEVVAQPVPKEWF